MTRFHPPLVRRLRVLILLAICLPLEVGFLAADCWWLAALSLVPLGLMMPVFGGNCCKTVTLPSTIYVSAESTGGGSFTGCSSGPCPMVDEAMSLVSQDQGADTFEYNVNSSNIFCKIDEITLICPGNTASPGEVRIRNGIFQLTGIQATIVSCSPFYATATWNVTVGQGGDFCDSSATDTVEFEFTE